MLSKAKHLLSRIVLIGLLLPLMFASTKTFAAAPDSSNDEIAGAIHLGGSGEKWAAKTLRKMSLEEKVGQMLMVWARVQFMNVDSADYAQLRNIVRKYHVGGFGLTVPTDGGTPIKTQPFEAAQLTNRLQQDSPFPLIFAADFERGLPMRINGATAFPSSMAFGAAGNKDFAFQFGSITATESRAIGVHWNWFPVADVNSNPANPIINTRAFSEDPQQVSELVTAYIAGARGAGMLTTVKHFPGHGDTDVDTHIGLARVNASRERLDSVELVPFRAAIAAGVDSVMVAHVTVPAVEPEERPASISERVVTGLLKRELGFNGIVVTDALDMGALTRFFTGTPATISGKAAVEAVKAGNDMVIIPADLDGAYNGLLAAARSGEISESRIDESVLKILRLKASVGLNKKRTVELTELERQIARPESLATAQKIAESAVTLVRNSQKMLPLRPTGTSTAALPYQATRTGTRTVVLIFADDVRTTEGGRAFDRAFRARVPDAMVLYLDEINSAPLTPQVLTAVQQAESVVAVTDVIPSAGRRAGSAGGSIALAPNSGELLAKIVGAAGEKTVVVAMGNPYVIASVPETQTYLCTFSNVPVSAVSAVRALFGEIPIRGRMPVTIPNLVERGAGLDFDPAR
jgi:beta-N-acetylhexosaminidase